MNSFHRALTLAIAFLCFTTPVRAAETPAAADFARGPHNGRLLVDGDFELELAIFETGVPPEYHVWASMDGSQIPPADFVLEVELTRLGGQVDIFEFATQEDYLRSLSVVEEPHSFDVAVTATYNGSRHNWAFPSYEGRVSMAGPLATQSGLGTTIAGAGTLQQQLKLYGQVMADPEQVRDLTARFPGVIRSVNASIGAQVNAGDVLATVESNESLRPYNITSPISGVVVARSANAGEATSTDVMFTIADYRQLVANFSVFPQDAARIGVGQAVIVMSGTAEVSSRIATLTPGANNAPTLTARVPLDNSTGAWTPGTWVNAFVTVAEIPAPLLIENRALQNFRDWQVVFIKIGDDYEIRPLELGRSDGRFTEVLAGLNSGDVYVVENSYLLKADLEKSGASHDH